MRINSRFLHYWILIILTGHLGSCTYTHKKLKVAKAVELGAAKMSDEALFEVLSETRNIHTTLEFSENSDEVLKRVSEKKIDLAIVANNVAIENTGKHIRTISAMLPRILLVLHPFQNDSIRDLRHLLYGRRVGFDAMNHSDSTFFELLFENNRTKWDDFECVLINEAIYESFKGEESLFDTVDIFISLTHLRNDLVIDLLEEGISIFSLDDPALFNRGSSLEGMTLDNPQIYPFMLPKFVFSGKPANPVLTVGVNDLLVCHKDLDEQIVYDIAYIIDGKRTILTQRNRNYGLLPDNLGFRQFSFSFPFHEGSIAYLERDKPTIFERYAELFGVLFSISLVIFGGITSIRRRIKQVKKDRIDDYYKQLLEVRNGISARKKSDNIQLLDAIRDHAFQSLMDEHLNADNSFEIFLNLYENIKTEAIDSSQPDHKKPE
jgi:TRAP-type uncharacterized transport system substrate-binding protein